MLFLIITAISIMHIYGIKITSNPSESVVDKETTCPENCVSPNVATDISTPSTENKADNDVICYKREDAPGGLVATTERIVDKEVFYPEKCVLPTGFKCIDFTGNESGVILVIQNMANFEIRDLKVSIKFPDVELACVDWSGDSRLIPEEIDTFSCTGPLYFGQHKGKITFDYVSSETGLAHSKSGDFVVDVSLDKVDNSPFTPP
jgi:hypothetical protein